MSVHQTLSETTVREIKVDGPTGRSTFRMVRALVLDRLKKKTVMYRYYLGNEKVTVRHDCQTAFEAGWKLWIGKLLPKDGYSIIG